ncbi:MAG TPA: galactokinase [Verrucomicrobiae bacterium]|jgi:galactokinase|nr:galactokinase [Verrucomicrobiae bacterium]
MSLNELAAHASDEFKKAYGRIPRWIAAAPGRVNLIGEHTDYNDGFVLPMAIERYTVIAADAPANGVKHIQFRSTHGGEPVTLDLAHPLKPFAKGNWINYPAGVIAGCAAIGLQTNGFDALVHSTVPLGGGLSSSAALEVATATVLEAMTRKKLDEVEKALICQEAEHVFACVPCGIMDQFISVMGRKDHAMLLDCRSQKAEFVPMTDPTISVLIINTNVKHELSGGEYAQRRQQCETAARLLGVPSLRDATAEMLERDKGKLDDVVFRRARHVIGEIERTLMAAEGFRESNWPTVGQLMYASHDSLRDDYEVSCAELDAVVDIAASIGPINGMIGCRMTGGGFGGCAVALVEANKVDAISKKISTDYTKRTGIQASMFVSRAGQGATVLKA